MKQTAVEFLIEKLQLVEFIEDEKNPHKDLKIIEQAIEMEIRQIQDACFEALKNEIISIHEISDDEIFEGVIEYCKIPHDRILAEVNAMIEGAKWYRTKLKTKI